MSQDSDISRSPDYYAARAAEERRLAIASKDSNVRAIHLELAERYEILARSGELGPRQPVEDQQRA